MIPPRFEYHAPKTVGEAVALLGQLGSDAKLLAGGHSLLPMMKLRFAQPEHLIDINRIPELRGIREEGGTVVIGGFAVNEMVTWNFAKPHPGDEDVLKKYSVNPPSVYGFGHQAYYEHVVSSIVNNTAQLVDGLAGHGQRPRTTSVA